LAVGRESGAVKGASHLSTSNVNSNTSIGKKYPSGGEPISKGRRYSSEILQRTPRDTTILFCGLGFKVRFFSSVPYKLLQKLRCGPFEA